MNSRRSFLRELTGAVRNVAAATQSTTEPAREVPDRKSVV